MSLSFNLSQQTCAGDYNNDPQIIKEWLSNKTAKNISTWITSSANIAFAAVDMNSKKIVGFALINKNGEILLNYVLPSYLYKGVGKFLLTKIENAANTIEIKALTAISTITAKTFYERNGFIKNGEPEYVGNILGDFPLIKQLKK